MIPIRYIDNHIVIDSKGTAYGYFIIPSANYAFSSLSKKIMHINKYLLSFFNYIETYDIYLLHRQMSPEKIHDCISELSSDPGWQRQSKITKDFLGKKLAFERVNVLCLPLRKGLSSKIKLDVKSTTREIFSGVNDVLKFINPLDNSFEISHDEIYQLRDSSDNLVKNAGFSGMRAATYNETIWCLQKGYFRGLPDPKISLPSPFPARVSEKNGKLIPNTNVLLTLSEGAMLEKNKHLEIYHSEDVISYQTFLPIYNVPSDLREDNPTGYEWIYGVLEQLNFPVDCALKIKVEPHTTAKLKAEKKNKRAKEQAKEWMRSENTDDAYFGQSELPEELLEDLEKINELRRKFREKQPLMLITGVFAVGAPELDQLNDRVQKLIEVSENKELVVGKPSFGLRHYFQDFYPFNQKRMKDNQAIVMDPGILAAAVPFGIRKLGDPFGFYLGDLFTEKPVYINPTRPMTELNRSGAILIGGTLGSGKTYLMKLLMFMMLKMGAYGFTNDPKGDWLLFCQHPEIKPITKIIAFTPGSETLFTPFRLSDDKSQCYDAALAILEITFNKSNDEYRNLVIELGIMMVQQQKAWDMFTFEHAMKRIATKHEKQKYREHADYIFDSIQGLKRHGIGRMMFGRDDGNHLFEEKRFVCAITRGLNLPSRGTKKQEWDKNETLSVAMMYAIITLALRNLMKLPRGTLKALSWEEFWFLKTFDKGIQLYNETLRLSRSEKMVPIMASQNPTDAHMPIEGEDEDITGLFGWKFMLRLDSNKQVEFALHNLMDMPDEKAEHWTETFSDKYYDGRGLVRDPEGNVGEMYVNVLDPELHEYLKSTPA